MSNTSGNDIVVHNRATTMKNVASISSAVMDSRSYLRERVMAHGHSPNPNGKPDASKGKWVFNWSAG